MTERQERKEREMKALIPAWLEAVLPELKPQAGTLQAGTPQARKRRSPAMQGAEVQGLTPPVESRTHWKAFCPAAKLLVRLC